MSNREDRQGQMVLDKKQRELDKTEAKVEAAQNQLEKFLKKALIQDRANLAKDALKGVNGQMVNDQINRPSNWAADDEIITGHEVYPWDED